MVALSKCSHFQGGIDSIKPKDENIIQHPGGIDRSAISLFFPLI